MAKEIQLTAEGLRKLKEELELRSTTKREEILERIKDARSQGDLSENSEYDQAREDQGFNEGRIQELEEMIKNAVVIDEDINNDDNGDVVNLGSTVMLEDVEFGDVETYTIVGTVEADPFNGLISNDSPVGAAVLGKKAGDEVEVITPSGRLQYKIVEIKAKE